jgi:hypothetical protein
MEELKRWSEMPLYSKASAGGHSALLALCTLLNTGFLKVAARELGLKKPWCVCCCLFSKIRASQRSCLVSSSVCCLLERRHRCELL